MNDAAKHKLPLAEETATERLGDPAIPSPLRQQPSRLLSDETERILAPTTNRQMEALQAAGSEIPSFEAAGARSDIYFNPSTVRCGIVTGGGLCPGLNNVIRSLVRTLRHSYGVSEIFGFRYGYRGMGPEPYQPPIDLGVDVVEDIHRFGGTLLGTCRGTPGVERIVDTIEAMGIQILFTIGGDGTLRGCQEISKAATARGLTLATVGIPKTIDNDLQWVSRSFGFTTAVEEASSAIVGAHEEARGAWNGVGLVKLMGRHSGFIATHTALANQEANFCLIPELPFDLDGPKGFLRALENRLIRKHHAVVVVAEGAGQELIPSSGDGQTDASGNAKLKDIGLFLKGQIDLYMKARGLDHTLKYIDPSYIIRSLPAGPLDSELCSAFAHHAAHAGMTGKTNVYIGHHNGRFIDVPIGLGVKTRKVVNPDSGIWRRILGATGQPPSMKN